MARKKVAQEGETKQERYRRVLNQRLPPLVKRFGQITDMVLQPSYDPSDNDLKLVKQTVTELYDKFCENYDRAIAGTLKAKETKEFTGVDWDKELEEPDEPTE